MYPSHAPRERTLTTTQRIAGAIGVLLASFVGAVLVYVAASGLGASDDLAGLIGAIATGLLIVGLSVVLFRQHPRRERAFALERRSGWAAIVGIALAAAVGARIAIGVITVIAQEIDSGLCEKLLELDLEPTPALWQKIALTIALVVIAPLGEELLFRVILLRAFVRAMPFAPAAWLNGALFSVTHLQYWSVWPVLVGVGLFGVANCYIYRRYGYAAAVLSHSLFNAAAAVTLFVDISDPEATCP